MIRPKKEAEDSIFSITENCEKPIEQTRRKAEESLEFKTTKPRETFHFNQPIQIKGDWMIRVTDLEVYNSIFKKTENKKLELYINPDERAGGNSYRKLRDEMFQILQMPIYKMI